MKKFSWYTIIHPDYEGWPAPPLYLVVNPDGTPEEVDGNRTCSIEYKPNRKGGYNRKDSHLLNVKMKKFYGKNKWRKKKKLFLKNVPFFEGVPKRDWFSMFLAKFYSYIMRNHYGKEFAKNK